MSCRPGGILHQWGWRGRWVRALQGVGTGIWYLLALLALRRVPSLVSWMGLPLLVTSSCLLVDSFREWTTNLRFAWAMAATLLGLSLAGEVSRLYT